MDNYEYCAKWVLNAAKGKTCAVLDYGCGAGQIVEILRKRGVDAYGCDIFYQGGDYSKSLKEEIRPYIRSMDAEKIPFASNMFDLITNNQVMEHVKDLDSVLKEIRRVLKPGGMILSLFPDKRVWREGHCGIPFLHWFPKHTQLRIYYAALFRTLGFGYYKANKNILTWSKDFCQWLDNWSWYKGYTEISLAFSKYFSEMRHIEDDWLHTRLGARAWLFCWIPSYLQRVMVKRLAGLVFICKKNTS